jgi:hypothetical protein
MYRKSVIYVNAAFGLYFYNDLSIKRIQYKLGIPAVLVMVRSNFFCLHSVDLAIKRVKTRVQGGGHNIEIDVIKRRYKNGINNLFDSTKDIRQSN